MTDKKLVKKIEKQLDSLLETQGYVETHIAGEEFNEKLEKKLLRQEKISMKEHALKAHQNFQTQTPIHHPCTNRGK